MSARSSFRAWVAAACSLPALAQSPSVFSAEPVPNRSVGSELNIVTNPPVVTIPVPSPPRPPAPIVRVDKHFQGYAFDDNATLNNGTLFIPPDPIGAVSINRVAAVVNCMIEVRSKAGDLKWRTSLQSFFAPAGSQSFLFDPKIVYDEVRRRFVVVALERIGGLVQAGSSNISRIYLAVSRNDSPDGPGTADWNFAVIDSKVLVSGFDFWADYPGFEVSEEAVYVTANMFSFVGPFYAGVRLWIIDKDGFYDGGTPLVRSYNPYASAGLPTTTMPSLIHGRVGSGIGTFLVSYSGLTEGGATGREALQVIAVRDPLGKAGGPVFAHQFVIVGNLENLGEVFGFPPLPPAPQAGTTARITTNDRRALDAVWRDGFLYVVATINPRTGVDAGQSTAHWWRLNTGNPAILTVADQGDVSGEDIAPVTSTFFPAVAVNRHGDMNIGFAASAPTIYAGAFGTGRRSDDPAGSVRSTMVVRAGEDHYFRTFSGTTNRWGDYTGIAVDPTNDSMFWVFGQYAAPRGTVSNVNQDGRWGTAWGRLKFQR